MPQLDAIELALPWGQVIRGNRWGCGPDAILLLHEPGTDLDAWGALPAQLAQALGVEVTAVDLPGHGLSDDPWEPEKAGEVVRLLIRDCGRLPRPTFTPLPPSSIAMGEGGADMKRRHEARLFVIAAGEIASSTLEQAAELDLAGLVLLSPSATHRQNSDPLDAVSRSPIAMGERGGGVRAPVPKLLIAGSLAGEDLATARRLASSGVGWTIVTSVPSPERGTALLKTRWTARLKEEITAFLRDCLRPRSRFLPATRSVPRGLD